MDAAIDNAIVVAKTAGAETTRQESVLNDMRLVLAKHAVSPSTSMDIEKEKLTTSEDDQETLLLM
ncbi:Ff.00g064520.m01.CDS01 [Fusarium sp. VM40]|nr:Ff.00g064520.m01.CDS01 [Fusarium sp. VM40]